MHHRRETLVRLTVIVAVLAACGLALHSRNRLFTTPASWRELFAKVILPPGNRLSRMQILQLRSQTQLKGIMKLVLDYEQEHGGIAPQALNEIVPDGRNDLLSIFCAPTELAIQKSEDRLTNREAIDEFTDYGMLSNATTGLLIFEKPGVWPDLTVAVCCTNMHVRRLSTSEFKRLTGWTAHANNEAE